MTPNVMTRLALIPREKWPNHRSMAAPKPEEIIKHHLEFVDSLLDIARGDAWIDRAETDGGVVPVVVWVGLPWDGQPETYHVCLADGERIAMPSMGGPWDDESEHIVVRVDTRCREDAEVHVRTLAALQVHVEGLLRIEDAAARYFWYNWPLDEINQSLEYERSSGQECAFLRGLRDGLLSRPARTTLEWYRTAYADRLGECHSAAYLNTHDENGRVSERQPHIDAALREIVRFGESLEQRGAERAELRVACRHLKHAMYSVVKTLRGLIDPAVRAVLELLPMRPYAADYYSTYSELRWDPAVPGLRVALGEFIEYNYVTLPSVSPGLTRGLHQLRGHSSAPRTSYAYQSWYRQIEELRSAARAFLLSCARLHREAPFLVRVRLAVAEGGLTVALSVEESTLASGLSHPATVVVWERMFGANAWALINARA